MGYQGQRLGQKKSSKWGRFKKGVAIAGAVGLGVLGLKKAHEAATKKVDEAPDKIKKAVISKAKEQAPVIQAKVEKVVEEHTPAAKANVKYLADQGAEALAQGGKAAVKAAINPFASASPAQAAAKGAAPAVMKVKAQGALIAEVGNKDAAAAIEDRYKLHTAPDVQRGGGAGSLGKFACQAGCASANPKRKGKKYNRCVERC